MSTFYGTVEGNRGVGTRCGTYESGIRASAQSYDGSVITKLDYNVRGELVVKVSMSRGSSCYGTRVWEGTFSDFVELLTTDTRCKEAHERNAVMCA